MTVGAFVGIRLDARQLIFTGDGKRIKGEPRTGSQGGGETYGTGTLLEITQNREPVTR
jgi:hypothetical protein